MASRRGISNGPPDSLGDHFPGLANHRLLDRAEEHALGRQLQAATRDVERLASEVPLTARLLLADWRNHREQGRSTGTFGARPYDTGDRLSRAMTRVRAALESVDDARREAEREPARRLLARRVRAAEVRFERIEAAAATLCQRAAEIETARRRSDRSALRRLAREFGVPVRTIAPRAAALEQAAKSRESARAALVLHNLRLVAHLARPLRGRGVPFGDLVQEGILGLMRAAEKFDPELGHRFSTYAGWWIQQALTRTLQKQTRTVRLPSHAYERLHRLLRLEAEARSREPRVEDLARATGYAVSEVEAALEQTRPVLSLDHRDGADDRPLLERLGQDVDPAAAPDRRRLERELSLALDRVPDREAEIVRLHFGLEQDDPKTLDEIARLRGLSRERTRQLKKRGLERMREILSDRRIGHELVGSGEMSST